MSHKDINVTFTIVAFRYDQKRSILYRNHPIPEEIALLVKRALERGDADVISIRRVYVKHPIELTLEEEEELRRDEEYKRKHGIEA